MALLSMRNVSLRFGGIDETRARSLGFIHDGVVDLAADHTVDGNPSRLT